MIGDRFRLGLGALLSLLVIIGIILSGCSSEEEAVLDDCLEQNSAYADQIVAVDKNWASAMQNVAESTDTSGAFGVAVNELMTLKKEMSGIDPPACAAEDHNQYVDGMNSIILMYQSVVAAPDANPDEATRSSAEKSMAALQSRFGEG